MLTHRRRLDRDGRDPAQFQGSDEYFEIYYELPLRDPQRYIFGTKLEPISLLDYLRIILQHYINEKRREGKRVHAVRAQISDWRGKHGERR
jgi:hypothetical protein